VRTMTKHMRTSMGFVTFMSTSMQAMSRTRRECVFDCFQNDFAAIGRTGDHIDSK
jgi:hypothetical protein